MPDASRSPSPFAPEVEISTLFYDDDGPHVLTSENEEPMTDSTPSAATHPVPIESLLLDRDGAIREALSLRDEMERRLRSVPGAEVELSGVVHELFDLLAIAAGGNASRG